MTLDTVQLLLHVALVVLTVWGYITLVRERIKRVRAERAAGAALVEQVKTAPEGATIILAAGTYRIAEPLHVVRDGISLIGAPDHLAKILVEGAETAIKVEAGTKGALLVGLYIESTGPRPKYRKVSEQDYLDEGLTPHDDYASMGR